MSLDAILWALNDAPTDDPQTVLVLLALAENAHRNGRYAWPSVKTMADRARCSERTVQRRLRELEADGLIRRGDQQAVAHFSADRRPVVYDLALHKRRGDSLTPRDVERGDTPGSHGVTLLSPEPSLEPTTTPLSPPKGGRRREVADDDPLFARFWATYPRRVAKGAARRAWPKALGKCIDGQTLVDGAARYAVECKRRRLEVDKIAHPSTWLNQERWLDETQATPGEQVGMPRRPPKRDEECDRHPGEYASNCRLCASERLAGDSD